MSDFSCAHHTATAYTRGGRAVVGELTPLTEVRWHRVRDEISTAEVTLPTSECCELLGDLRTILHELHIFRDGEPVWEGPITRLEYEWDVVRIYAEDVLWQSKRTVLQVGYSNAYPNIGHAMARMDWLLRDQCYALHGDPWNVVPHLRPVTALNAGPRTSRVVHAFETTVWQDFDRFAEDGGTDYTVANRDVFYWDHGIRWLVLPDLDEAYLGQFPRIVEYGNQLYTRGFVSNAKGYAGVGVGTRACIDAYGYVDMLTTNLDDSGDLAADLAEAQADVVKAQDNVVFMQDGYNNAVAEMLVAQQAALLQRERADVADAEATIADLDADAAQDVADSYQEWADDLQRDADRTGDEDLAATARAARDWANSARDQADRFRQQADAYQEIADSLAAIAAITGLPEDQAAAAAAQDRATYVEGVAQQAEADAQTIATAADQAEAASHATNDPAKQAAADQKQAEANAHQAAADAAAAHAKAVAEQAKEVDKLANAAESNATRAESNADSWADNVTEAQEDLANAQADVAEVIAKLQAAIVVWSETAQRNVADRCPSPVGIVIPEGTTLLPGSGWTVQDLVPGAYFRMTIERLCRQVTAELMINEVTVEETAPAGERVAISAASVDFIEEVVG